MVKVKNEVIKAEVMKRIRQQKQPKLTVDAESSLL